MEVKIVIDGEEIKLVPKGQYQGCEKFTGPKEISGLVATVFVRLNWDLKKRRIKSNPA